MKTCNKCTFTHPDLDWDREKQKKEGVWKLAIISKDSSGNVITIPHVCPNEQEKVNFNDPLIQCDECSSFRGWFRKTHELHDHKRIYH